jgi:hypothetical protein
MNLYEKGAGQCDSAQFIATNEFTAYYGKFPPTLFLYLPKGYEHYTSYVTSDITRFLESVHCLRALVISGNLWRGGVTPCQLGPIKSANLNSVVSPNIGSNKLFYDALSN